MIFMNFPEIHDFSRKTGFLKKIKVFQGFPYLGWYGTRPASRLEGSGGSLGIGPQGRHNVLRHSREARGTIVIDRDGLESPQVILNSFSGNFQKMEFI